MNSNVDAGFVVYSVGPRARELELKIGDVLMDLPEAQLYVPTPLDLPRDSQMPNPLVYRSALNILVRLGEYLWEKGASLPANFRREAESVLQHDYRPLIARGEQLILRAVEFHREEEVPMPSFLPPPRKTHRSGTIELSFPPSARSHCAPL